MAGTTDKFAGIFKEIQHANPSHPWEEYVCDESQKLFVDDFFESIDNIPRLLEEDQPILFRGQQDSRWTLKPKLVRLWESVINPDNYEEVLQQALDSEYDSIRHFQQKAHLFLEVAKSLDRRIAWSTIGDWVALMQHYSAPTRFLDWTSSFHVALYFAAQDDNSDGAVWIFFIREHVDCMDKLFKQPDVDEGDQIVSGYESFRRYGLTAPPRVEAFANDFHTDRIVNQRGVFTFSYKLFFDHAMAGIHHLKVIQKPLLYKIVIPATMKRKIRLKLAKINIATETLFPGIDGLGKSIYEKIGLLMDVSFPKSG